MFCPAEDRVGALHVYPRTSDLSPFPALLDGGRANATTVHDEILVKVSSECL
jgi:hypothetical protein